MPTQQKLEPPDRERCQAEKPNKEWSPFRLGPCQEMIRCENVPAVVVTEQKAPKRGAAKGSMSLCADCMAVFARQVGMDKVTIEQIRRRPSRKVMKVVQK